jgi:cytolysin (calcineurin-like family phosphatase)
MKKSELKQLIRGCLEENTILENDYPICPFCKTKMYPTTYEGYYDSFSYWDCACDTFPVKTHTRTGQFVGG